jgi:hypothetical protein
MITGWENKICTWVFPQFACWLEISWFQFNHAQLLFVNLKEASCSHLYINSKLYWFMQWLPSGRRWWWWTRWRTLSNSHDFESIARGKVFPNLTAMFTMLNCARDYNPAIFLPQMGRPCISVLDLKHSNNNRERGRTPWFRFLFLCQIYDLLT